MEQVDVLRDAAQRLDRLALPWMLVGSYASGYYGEPRFTNDVDVVIAYREQDIPAIVAAFEDDYYVDAGMLSQALQYESLSNVIHNATSHKVDLSPLRQDDYSQVALQRRTRIDMGGFEVWIATAEDMVLAKLHWAKDSRSEMQFRDVLNVMRVTTDLDLRYLRLWALRLGVSDDLERLLAEAEELG
jgi:hypothetical protein